MASNSAAKEVDLRNHRGDTQQYTFNFKVNGTAENLTSATFLAQIRRHKNDNDVLATLTYNASDSTLASGVVAFDLSEANSKLLPETSFYDIQYTIGSIVKTRVRGRIFTEIDVSRS